MTLKALGGLLDNMPSAAALKLQCAAAYLATAYRWQTKQRQTTAGQSSGAAAAGASVEVDEGEQWESDDEEERQVDGVNRAGAQQGAISKDQEVALLVRLCFQWVVGRELEQLSMQLV